MTKDNAVKSAHTKKRVDYDRIEPGWRAGVLSPRELALEYQKATGETVSHAAIIKHFNKAGIERDLADKIKSKADALVTRNVVTAQVTAVTSPPTRVRSISLRLMSSA